MESSLIRKGQAPARFAEQNKLKPPAFTKGTPDAFLGSKENLEAPLVNPLRRSSADFTSRPHGRSSRKALTPLFPSANAREGRKHQQPFACDFQTSDLCLESAKHGF